MVQTHNVGVRSGDKELRKAIRPAVFLVLALVWDSDQALAVIDILQATPTLGGSEVVNAPAPTVVLDELGRCAELARIS